MNQSTNSFIFIEAQPQRIDTFLSRVLSLSRNEIQKMIKNGAVMVNNKLVQKTSFLLTCNNEISINLSSFLKVLPVKNDEIKIKDFSDADQLKIVYEDEWCMVVYKPTNTIVYPAFTNDTNTLAHRLRKYFVQFGDQFGDDLRQGIVHRLDRNTSGLVLVAKTKAMYDQLRDLIHHHLVERRYYCLVHHRFNDDFLNKENVIDIPIGYSSLSKCKMQISNAKHAQPAITIFSPLKNLGNNYALVECRLVTGRTHQIRVHMQYIKHSIVNDNLYGFKTSSVQNDLYGQYLMCYHLDFIHPITQQKVDVTIAMDEQFQHKIQECEHE